MKRTKKPVVNKNRKQGVYKGYVDLYDGKPLRDIQRMFDIFIEEIDQLTLEGFEPVSIPYLEVIVDYNDCDEYNLCQKHFTETEEAWKDRVEAEEKALKEWQEDKTNAEIEKLRERLKELEGETK